MINIIKTKNVCARIAWIIEIYAGKNNKTVNPPNNPCTITSPKA